MENRSAVVLTWGCSHNQKDSQLIEYQLKIAGVNLLHEKELGKADIVVLNTCTVKTPTEDKIFHVLDTLSESEQTIVVAGCITQSEPELIEQRYPNFIRLGVNAAGQILEALDLDHQIVSNDSLLLNMINPSIPVLLGQKNNKTDWLEKPMMGSTQWNPHLNIIPINEGCLNSCSFCATKKARGHLRSYSRDSIITAIRNTPTPEVWLTSQDTSCWGFDLNENLTDLIHDIDQIKRKFWARIGMGNPNNMIKFIDDLVQAYHSDKIYKFVHVPVQAGNNDVLSHMKRGYTVEEYELIIRKFRAEFPDITISTDVICGYPTESEEDFEETIRTIKTTRPSITNISRYWERRGTPAAGMKQLPFSERKRRSTILAKLCKDIQFEENKKWVGWEGEIYLAEEGSKGGIQARNMAYKPIIVDLHLTELGKFSHTRITEAKSTYFRGEILAKQVQ